MQIKPLLCSGSELGRKAFGEQSGLVREECGQGNRLIQRGACSRRGRRVSLLPSGKAGEGKKPVFWACLPGPVCQAPKIRHKQE